MTVDTAAQLAWSALSDIRFAHVHDVDRWGYPHPAQRIAPWVLARTGNAPADADQTAEEQAATVLGVDADSPVFDRSTFARLEEAVEAEFGPRPDMSGWTLAVDHDDENERGILGCPACADVLTRFGSDQPEGVWFAGTR